MAPDIEHARIRAAVRDYLNKWETWEKKNGKDAVIGNAERVALLTLIQHPFEQEIDDHNYVGELHEWAAKEKTGGRVSTVDDEEFTDTATNQRRFRVRYKLPGGRGVFPRKGYGIEPGKPAPSYPQKKRARQAAAKWALVWLAEHSDWGYSADSAPEDSASEDVEGDTLVEMKDEVQDAPAVGRDGANRLPRVSSNSPDRKKVKFEDPEARKGAPIGPPEWSKVPQKSSFPSDEPASIGKQVDDLAKKLGLDAPRYTTQRGDNGLWFGRPVFQLDGKMPEDLGAVTNMASEQHAKAEMARLVFEWLDSEGKNREKDIAKVLESMVDDLE